MDPMRFLAADTFERSLMAAIASGYAGLREHRDEQQAIRIANNVGARLGL